jgi:hypothetical protein
MRAWTLASAAALLGCSPAVVSAPPGPDAATSDVGASGGDESTIKATCTSYAYARCSKLQNCSPTGLLNRYGTTAECEAIYAGLCENVENAPSTGATPATVAACSTALSPNAVPLWACSDFLYNENIPAGCATVPGSLANGAPCGVAQQCHSGYCALPLYGACGTCAPVPPTGSSCAELVCPPTLSCFNQVCVAYAQEGASCGANQPCSDGVMCVAGTCTQGVSTANMPCVFTGAGCDFYDGLACNAQTGLCEQAMLGAAGQACGTVGAQSVSCISGTCDRGACVAYLLPGQPCDTAGGAPCITDARCVVDVGPPDAAADGGTAGTCQLNGASVCH